MEADDATRNPEFFLQTLDRKPDDLLSEIRRKTTACFPILQHRGFYFPPAASKDRAVNSAVGGSALKPEIGKQDNHTSDGAHQHAFLHSNIEDSTFPHQPKAGGPPFLSRTGNVLHASVNQLFSFLPFNKVKEVQHIIVIPSDSHSGFYFPPSAAQMVPLSPERETYGIFLFIQLLHSCLLRRGKSATCYRYSYTLTYRILLSPTSQRLAVRPFSPERETFCMLSFAPTYKN